MSDLVSNFSVGIQRPALVGRLFASLLLALSIAGFILVVGAGSAEDFMDRTSRGVGFVLKELNVSGLNRTQYEDVLRVLDMDQGTPLISVDLAALKTSIEALPWVVRADIARRLPSALDVTISERQAFALWQKNGQLHLIDRAGKIIDGVDLAAFKNLRLYVGGGAGQTAAYLDTAMTPYADLNKRLMTAVRVGQRRWDLVFDTGVRVKMPEDSDPALLKQAMEKFDRLQAQYQLLERDVTIIDLRVPNRLVLRVSPDAQLALPDDLKQT